jgi:hypothetical protein
MGCKIGVEPYRVIDRGQFQGTQFGAFRACLLALGVGENAAALRGLDAHCRGRNAWPRRDQHITPPSKFFVDSTGPKAVQAAMDGQSGHRAKTGADAWLTRGARARTRRLNDTASPQLEVTSRNPESAQYIVVFKRSGRSLSYLRPSISALLRSSRMAPALGKALRSTCRSGFHKPERRMAREHWK